MKRMFSKYIIASMATCLTLLSLAAALNLLADPFAVFGTPGPGGLRDQQELGSRIAKAELARRSDAPIVILGNSRAETGYDPQSPAFRGTPAINLGLTGAGAEEVIAAGRYALAQHPRERLIIGIDLVMFDKAKRPAADFAQSRFSEQYTPVQYYAANLLGWRATRTSWGMLGKWREGELAEYGDAGLHLGGDFNKPPRKLFERVLTRAFDAHTGYPAFELDDGAIAAFEAFLREADAAQVPVDLVISPIHATQLEAIAMSFKWDELEAWKRQLVAAVEPLPRVRLLDFHGFAGPNAEPVPARDARTGMRWYYESSHFTPALGDRVLTRMLGAPSPADQSGPLGVELTAGNLDAHLAQLWGSRDAWRAANPDVVAWLEELKGRRP